jgi:hypothetical protein
LIAFYETAETEFMAMKNCKGKLSFVGKWKEYLKIEKFTLLETIMELLNLKESDKEIDQDL